jgi:post-segregation antitoxin (ccd killing protein)
MASKYMRKDVIYQRSSIDIPVDVKADVEKYGINVAATALEAIKKAIAEKKRGG